MQTRALQSLSEAAAGLGCESLFSGLSQSAVLTACDHVLKEIPTQCFSKGWKRNKSWTLSKKKKSTDYDGIDRSIVKEVIEGISEPLTRIWNSSFQTGSFPNKMMIQNHFTNSRSVSILSQLSKIPEKLSSQYRFRSNQSTLLAWLKPLKKKSQEQ